MKCLECYSEKPRITPLLEPEHCLRNHMQYICSTCGRHICIDVKGKARARCFMPFSSLETAKLYLKCAEILSGGLCGIYELQDKKSGRKSYKIYSNKEDLRKYLKSNPGKTCSTMEPVYMSECYMPVKEGQIRRLKDGEIEKYLEEQKKYTEVKSE
jgi:hypothetical protein